MLELPKGTVLRKYPGYAGDLAVSIARPDGRIDAAFLDYGMHASAHALAVAMTLTKAYEGSVGRISLEMEQLRSAIVSVGIRPSITGLFKPVYTIFVDEALQHFFLDLVNVIVAQKPLADPSGSVDLEMEYEQADLAAALVQSLDNYAIHGRQWQLADRSKSHLKSLASRPHPGGKNRTAVDFLLDWRLSRVAGIRKSMLFITMAHEMAHIALGHVKKGAKFSPENELLADDYMAALLTAYCKHPTSWWEYAIRDYRLDRVLAYSKSSVGHRVFRQLGSKIDQASFVSAMDDLSESLLLDPPRPYYVTSTSFVITSIRELDALNAAACLFSGLAAAESSIKRKNVGFRDQYPPAADRWRRFRKAYLEKSEKSDALFSLPVIEAVGNPDVTFEFLQELLGK